MAKAKRRRRAASTSPLQRDHNGVEVRVLGDDRGPDERWTHDAHVDDRSERGGPTVRKLLDVCPLDHYQRRGQIEAVQWQAGNKLRNTWAIAGMEPRMCASLETLVRGKGEHFADLKHDKLIECVRILREVGPELAPILLHVVCQEGTAPEWAALKGMRGNAAKFTGMTTLRLALDALARVYHLT